MSSYQRRDFMLLAAAIAGALLAALPILTYPMGRDQGMYANIARTILDGGLPFIHMWDIKPPAIYYVYAGVIALFGPGAAALRALDLLTVPLTMAVLFALGLRLTGRRGMAALSALAFAAFCFTETFASLTQSDSVATLPVALAALATLRAGDAPRGSRRAIAWAGLAGMACAAALWFKHYYALIALALVAGHAARRMTTARGISIGRKGMVYDAPTANPQDGDRGFPMREALAFCAGGLVIGLPPLLYFIATGVLAEMLIVLSGTSQYNAQAATGLGALWAQFDSYLLFRWWHWGPLIVAAAAWPGLVALRVVPRPAEGWGAWGIVGLWTLGALGFVVIQAKGFDTHWLPLLPPLALFGGATADALIGLAARRRGRVAGALYALVVVGLALIVGKDTWARAWPYLTGTETQVAYFRRFQANDMKPDESLNVVRWLARRTTPGDTLYIWGFRPEVYYLTGLRPATRFQAQFPLASAYYPPEWRDENVDLLWAALPPYVLVLQADWMPWVTGRDEDSAWMLAHDYGALNDWLICNYARQREMGDFIVWARRAQNCLADAP